MNYPNAVLSAWSSNPLDNLKLVLLSAGLILIIGLLPFGFDNYTDLPKLIVVHIAIIGTFLIDYKQGKKYNFDNGDILIISFVSLHFLSYFWTTFPSLIWYKSIHWVTLYGLYVLVKNTQFERQERYWSNLVLFTSLFNVAVIAHVLYTSGINISQISRLEEFSTTLHTLIGHNRNIVSSSLVIMLPILALISKQSKLKTLFTIVIFASYILLTILCSSRASFFAVIPGLIGLILIHRRSLLTRKSSLIIGSSIIILGSLLVSTNMNLIKYLNPISSLQAGSGDDRLQIWHTTLDLIGDRPIIGHGSSTWKINHLSKNTDHFYNADRINFQYTHAHNLFLEAGAELGLIGMLLLILIILAHVLKVIKDNSHHNYNIALFLSLLSMFIVINFYFITYTNSINFGSLDIIMVILLALTARTSSTSTLFKFSNNLIIPILLISFAYHLFMWNSQSQLNNTLVNSTGQETELILKEIGHIQHPFFFQYSGHRPIDYYKSRYSYNLGNIDQAIFYNKKAIQLHPYSAELWTWMGRLYTRVKNPEDAKAVLLQAIDLKKRSLLPKLLLANLYVKDDNADAVHELLDNYYIDQVNHMKERYDDSIWDLSDVSRKKDFWITVCTEIDQMNDLYYKLYRN